MAKKILSSRATSSRGKSTNPKSTVLGESRVYETFTIQNALGLHARAAASFVKVANRFRSRISVCRETTTVNGKSIMGVLMLAAANGTKIEVIAEGPDATEAIQALGTLIGERFGER